MITYTVTTEAGGRIGSRIKSIRFPGGEVGVKLQQPVHNCRGAIIHARITSSDEVMELLMVVDAMRRQNPLIELVLDMPYVPYARQDRVCDEGESLSIAVFAQLINSCGFRAVRIFDPHSDVTPALINNCVVSDQFSVFAKVKLDWSETVIVAPDAGAYKKAFSFAKRTGAKGVITFTKVRDMVTGRIEEMTPSGDFDPTLPHFVIDDICDGGRTFVELGQMLADVVRLELAVTHGIFSKGVEVLEPFYDHVYTTDSFHGESLASTDFLTVLEV